MFEIRVINKQNFITIVVLMNAKMHKRHVTIYTMFMINEPNYCTILSREEGHQPGLYPPSAETA